SNYMGCTGDTFGRGLVLQGGGSASFGTCRIRDCTDGLSNTFLGGERAHLLPRKDWNTGTVPIQGTAGVWPGFLGEVDPASGYGQFLARTWFRMQDGYAAGYVLYGFLLAGPTQNFASYHPGGAQFVLGDGSVRFVSENISYKFPPVPPSFSPTINPLLIS